MPPRRVSEAAPVQVYLSTEERQRLEHLADHLETNKSEVIRRGLLALERELYDLENHPAIRLIGIGTEEIGPPLPYNVSTNHHRALADLEEASWGRPYPLQPPELPEPKQTGSTPRGKRRGR